MREPFHNEVSKSVTQPILQWEDYGVLEWISLLTLAFPCRRVLFTYILYRELDEVLHFANMLTLTGFRKQRVVTHF